jgi:hypothetical protein
VLSVGLGAIDTGFDAVGEATDRKTRAELMDEGLELMERFWSGKPFRHKGQHYQVKWGNSWSYTPYEKARVPVWVVALWGAQKTVDRALRWDGILPAKKEVDGSWGMVTPEDVRELAHYAARNRTQEGPFDIVIEGMTLNGPQEAQEKVAPYAAAGATWWIESMWDAPGGMKAVMKRIRQGPPGV